MRRSIVHLKIVLALQLPQFRILAVEARNIHPWHTSTRRAVSSIIINVKRSRSSSGAMVLAVTSCRRWYVEALSPYALPPCSRIHTVPIGAGLRVARRGPGEWIRLVGVGGETQLRSEGNEALLKGRLDTISICPHVGGRLVDAGAHRDVDRACHGRIHRRAHGLDDERLDVELVVLMLLRRSRRDGVVDGSAFRREMFQDLNSREFSRLPRSSLQNYDGGEKICGSEYQMLTALFSQIYISPTMIFELQ